MRVRNIALTLAIGLGLAGFVCADESGNWFTRLFSPSASAEKKIEPAKVMKTDAPMPPSARSIRVKQATADKERRDAVCLKLRDLAIAHGDEEMFRKVEQLERRIGDIYFAQLEVRDVSLAEANGKKGGR
jgi:hypothetical protein